MNINLISLYRFWVQVFVGLLVLSFCGFGIISRDLRNVTLYSNLGFLVLGWFTPSPGAQVKKDDSQIAIDSEQTNIVSGPTNE